MCVCVCVCVCVCQSSVEVTVSLDQNILTMESILISFLFSHIARSCKFASVSQLANLQLLQSVSEMF